MDLDVLVIGGGSAGYAAARVAGQMGARIGLVERGPVGGLCILEGCMPSKALLRAADVLHLLRRADRLGIHAPDVRVDFAQVMARKRHLVDEFAAERRPEIAKAAGVTLLLGQARLDGAGRVTLSPVLQDGQPAETGADGDGSDRGPQHLTARKIILTTGSQPVIPSLDGLETIPYVTSDGALSLDAPPESMVVIGSGPVALELGQFYARIGTLVTLLAKRPHILSHEDPEVADALQAHLSHEGIALHTNAIAKACRRGPNGEAVVIAEVDGTTREFSAAIVLVATGRKPATRGLGLESAGVRVDDKGGFVTVDRAMRSSNPDVYAAGDVASQTQATHLAVLQGEVAGFNAAHELGFNAENAPTALLPPEARRLGGVPHPGPDGTLLMDYTVVPQVLFTDPPFARAGMNEHAAREAGIKYVTAREEFSDHGMAQLMGQTRGFVKLLAERESGRLLGAQILGYQADTLIHEVVVALAFGATAQQLARIPHYHPTLSEILSTAAENLAQSR